jgi:hypothetical protein
MREQVQYHTERRLSNPRLSCTAKLIGDPRSLVWCRTTCMVNHVRQPAHKLAPAVTREAPLSCEFSHSLDTPHQRPQIPTLSPIHSLLSTSLTPSLTNLAHNPRRLPCYNAPRRDHHSRRHHSSRQQLAILLNNAGVRQNAVRADVDIRRDRQAGDVAAGPDEDVVADLERVVGPLAST